MSNLQLTGHAGEVLTIRYNDSTTLLASGGMDKLVFLWDCRDSYSNVSTLKSHTNAITSIDWNYSDRLMSASADRSVCNWDVENGRVVRKYRGHTSIVHGVACPRKTRDLIGSVGDDGILRIWESRSK